MAVAPLTIIADRRADIQKALKMLTETRVLVGIPASNTSRDEAGITNAELGYIHEYGSPANNIPARPFLSMGVKAVMTQITTRIENAGKAALSGNEQTALNYLKSAGQAAASSVQRMDGPFAPLSPRTIAGRKKKARKGATGGVRPLIDTGALRASITWVLRRNGMNV